MADPKTAAPDPAAELTKAQGARDALEAENKRLIDRLAAPQQRIYQPPPPPAPPQAPPRPDPLDRLASEDLVMQPGEKKQAWDEAINRRVQAGVNSIAQKLEERSLWREQTRDNEFALRLAVSQNPEMVQDEEGVAAAMAKAQLRAQRQGRQLSGPDLVQSTVDIWKEQRTPNAPVLEGSSLPSAPGAPGATPAPVKKSWFETKYGARPNDELHEEQWDEEAGREDYLLRKNNFLAEKGLTSMIPEINKQHEGRRKADDPSLVPDSF